MDLIGLIPQFGNLAFTIAAFVVALSVIVAVHEYGHYIVGRWSGIQADVFSLGFGPVIWSGRDKRGTRWQVAALPFGGYVKFKGDADPAGVQSGSVMFKLSPEERRRTMHGAPLWARAATVAAGPIFNFILSIAILTGYFLSNGVTTDEAVVGQMKPMPFEGVSLLPGDRITAVNGTETPTIERFIKVARALPPLTKVTYQVARGDTQVSLDGPYPFPPIADSIMPGSPARNAGIEPGDVVQAVDGKPVASFEELRTFANASQGKPMVLTLWRSGTSRDVTLATRLADQVLPDGGFEKRWQIGMSGGLAFEPATRSPGVAEAVSLAGSRTWQITTTSLSAIWQMVQGRISPCNLQGPIGIAETSGNAASEGFGTFLLFIAMLSTGVGLLNLFPIPVLDGGHLVFYAYEAVSGRPPADRALRVLMVIGLAVILTLMVFALGNDLSCP